MKKALFLLLAIALSGCAKIVTPTGGPKDTKPPEIVKVEPENNTTLFTGNTIRITFNEYVVLDNAAEKVIFSPPLKNSPDFSISKKSVIIKLKDTLRENTTYNVGFSDCIKDFTEGNMFPFYNYTFSTGDHIDSFTINGFISNALTLEPEKNCFVFLYDENIDSLPTTKRPTYVTKTLSSGNFTFYNIQKGDYKIFALRDRNNNLLFDLADESIAFSERLVSAVPYVKNKIDSTVSKSDTDSIDIKKKNIEKDTNRVKMVMFTEKDTVQRFIKQAPVRKGVYTFIYKKPLTTFTVTTLDSATTFSYFESISPTKDTVTFYLKEMIQDSVYLKLIADGAVIDTIAITPYRTAQRGLLRQRNEKNEPLSITASNLGELYRPLTLNFSYPVKPVDSFDITFIQKKKSGNDTLVNRYSVPDSFVLSLPIPFKIEEKVPYTLMIKDSVFEGYNTSLNDSLTLNFNTKSEKDYGNLSINYSIPDANAGTHYIVSLLSSDNKTVKTDIIQNSVKINYSHLTPGNYKIKVVEDTNQNGEWDTGNYKKKIQPEKIFFFQKPITIRGYWDLEETFDFSNAKTDKKD